MPKNRGTLKSWLVKVPEDVYTDIKVYAVRQKMHIIDLANRAIDEYIADVEAGKISATEGFDGYDPKNLREWMIQVDEKQYIDMKLFIVKQRVLTYQATTCMFLHFLKRHIQNNAD